MRFRALAGPGWVLLAATVVQLLFFFDWGQGVVRAALVVVLGLTTLGAERVGLTRSPRLGERTPTVDALAVVVLAVFTSINLFVGGESLGLLVNQGREGEMGALNYRALRLLAHGVSPYAPDALLDEVRYRALVSDPDAARCLEPHGDVAVERFTTYWASVDPDDLRAAWPRRVGQPSPASASRRRPTTWASSTARCCSRATRPSSRS